jgi:hypothetical protein
MWWRFEIVAIRVELLEIDKWNSASHNSTDLSATSSSSLHPVVASSDSRCQERFLFRLSTLIRAKLTYKL